MIPLLTARTSLSAMLGAAALTTVATGSATMIEHYEGIAFDHNNHELYRESHWLSGNDGARQRLVLYTCPDGKPFARKRVREAGNSEAPGFELDDGRSAYREGVRMVDGGQREVFVRARNGGVEKQATLDPQRNVVIDTGFDAFIRDRWDSLKPGARETLDFLVPSQLDTIELVVRRLEDDELAGTPVRRYRLELMAWYAFAVPAIDIAYDADTRLLREYKGIANIRDNSGRNLDVRIEFPRTPAAASDAESLASADRVALDGRCRL